MNRTALRQLGYTLGARAPGGASQGAWFATAPGGRPVVLKWSPEPGMAARYEALLPGLGILRARGVPVPAYLDARPFDGGTLSVQEALPGRSEDTPNPAAVAAMARYIAAQTGLDGPPPPGGHRTWGAFVTQTLTAGQEGWAPHTPLRSWGRQSAAMLDRIALVGQEIEANIFPQTGLVHLDLHTDNVLIQGDRVTGIIDWEGACAGDPGYDLVQFAFDLDGHGQPAWDIVEAEAIAPPVLRAYLALLALKCTAAAIQNRPADVPRQLTRANRVFTRYGV